MNKQLLNRIQEIFFARLNEKTGWGKNEIKEIYKEAVNEALMEFLEQDD